MATLDIGETECKTLAKVLEHLNRAMDELDGNGYMTHLELRRRVSELEYEAANIQQGRAPATLDARDIEQAGIERTDKAAPIREGFLFRDDNTAAAREIYVCLSDLSESERVVSRYTPHATLLRTTSASPQEILAEYARIGSDNIELVELRAGNGGAVTAILWP